MGQESWVPSPVCHLHGTCKDLPNQEGRFVISIKHEERTRSTHRTHSMNARTHARTRTHTHTDRCSPTPGLTQMTACHGLNVTSQLRPPPCQPLMPPGATITPYRDTEKGRGMLPQGGGPPALRRPPPVNQEETGGGAAHLFSSLNLHVKQHGKKKRKKQGSSRVASVKLPSIPALSFPICTTESKSTAGSPYGREALGSEGQSLPVLEFSAVKIRACWQQGESGPSHLG